MSTRNLFSGWGKIPVFFIIIIVSYWAWIGFKLIEPKLMPVVTSFTIYDSVILEDDKIIISGEMNKVRDCEILQIVAYDVSTYPKSLINVEFIKRPGKNINRGLGVQKYGPWALYPKTRNITISVDHMCATGKVNTNLFSGALW